jgi:pimeloyl-ACP methyl ester carboxylesterase
MKITVGDIEFGYDRGGSGDPVLLVMGLGTPRIGWFPQFMHLTQAYDVVSFDNRGVGETACASGWTLPDMASDAVGIADAIGWERFHLVGISMGGMISQEIVLTWPDRVRSLTLIATSPGGPEAQMMTPEYAQALQEPDPKQRMRRATELTFGRRFREDNPQMMELILSTLESGAAGVDAIGGEMGAGFMGQVMAVATWMGAGGAAHRLSEIAAPTLVMHGADDLLLPVGNGEILARDVPEARSRIFPDGGHALNAEYADEVNRELVQHFEEASTRV